MSRQGKVRAAAAAGLAAASIAGVAVAADPGSPAVDYPAASGLTMTGVRPTALGLPQLGVTGTVGAGELANAVRSYHDSGRYDQDLAAVGAAAKAYMLARLDGSAKAPATAAPTATAPAGAAPGGGSGTGSGSATSGAGRQAAKGCTTRYVRIRRAKGRAALYRRVRSCPKRTAKARAAQAAGRPAIVLDIDETSLSNYAGLVASGFTSVGTAIPAATGTGTAIAPTLELYKAARAHGVAVFFITGRPSVIAAATEDNLKKAGYDQGWDGLQFKPTDQGTEAFKAGARAAIEAKGYDIVANVGDQESDLDGGHADRAFKLPNPYYFIAD